MTTIEMFDLGVSEPTVIEAVPDDRRLVDLSEIRAGDSLVLVDETDESAEFNPIDLDRTVGGVAQGKLRLMLLRNPRAKVAVRVEYAGDSVEAVSYTHSPSPRD